MTTDNSAVIARLQVDRDKLAKSLREEVEFRLNVERQRDELAEALQAVFDNEIVLKWTSKKGGPNRYSSQVQAADKMRDALANLDSELDEQSAASINNHWSIEPHGKGWAIYRGRDNQSHGFNLGQLTETTEAAVVKIEEALNSRGKSEQPAVPERWSVEQYRNTYLIQKHDANGEFIKGEWIDPEVHGHVICEMLSDMAQIRGRE